MNAASFGKSSRYSFKRERLRMIKEDESTAAKAKEFMPKWMDSNSGKSTSLRLIPVFTL